MHTSIPDFAERSRLAALAAAARRANVRVRRLRHVCGHTQGHAIASNSNARREYARLAAEPCGACA